MRRIIENIIKVLLILLIVGWVVIVFVDYFRNLDGKEPKFCLKEETKQYPDGEVYICTGLGYKAYKYDRKSVGGTAFGPFFTKEKTKADDTIK